MKTARFSLPDGWNYGDLRAFLESELQEDFGSDYNWIWLRDFTDTDVYYTAGDGDLIQRPYTIQSGDAIWGQPTEVVARTIYQPVASMAAYPLATFAAAADGYVLRTGKIFEAGEYADKGFAITPEELAAAAREFRAVPNNIEHGPCVLDGKLGELRAVEARGRDLFGTVAIPEWLHETVGDKPLKVSLEWIRKTKRIAGNALVLNPRVPDAALMAAFSASAAFAGKRHSATDQDALDAAHAAIVKAGANCEGKADMSDAHKIGVFDTLKALFTGESQSPAARSSAVPPARAKEQDVAELDELKGQIATLTQAIQGMQAQFSTTAEQQQRTRAAEYADAAIRANKALPAERGALVALFAQALADDAAHAATVTFGAGEQDKGGRVDALVALVRARPAHRMTEELVPDNVTTLFADGRDQKKPGSVADDVQAAVAYATANGMARAE
jgi:hypothetical protein